MHCNAKLPLASMHDDDDSDRCISTEANEQSRGFVFQQKSTPHITSPHPKTNEPIFQPESPPGKEVLEPSASTSHPRFVLLTHHAGGF
jgi:hypothetical protein